MHIITGSTTLRSLDVTANDIGDEGIAMISEALQGSKTFTMLGVAGCELSVKGMASYNLYSYVVLIN